MQGASYKAKNYHHASSQFCFCSTILSFSMAFSSHLQNDHKLLMCSNLTDRMLAFLFCLPNEHHYVLLGLKSSVSPSLKILYILSFVTCPLFREKASISLSVPLNYCIEYSRRFLGCYLFLYLVLVRPKSRIQPHTREMYTDMYKFMCACAHIFAYMYFS